MGVVFWFAMYIKNIFIFLFVVFSYFHAFAVETGALLLGGFGSIVTHEAGHALTTHFLGGEVLAFRPYPTKVRFEDTDGTYKDKWVGGLVKHSKFTGENADANNALVAAMGSGGNMLSVILLAPLLPTIASDFVKNSLDSMLFFSCFDAPAYVTTNLIFQDPNDDWSQVSKLTGVSLYWYLLGTLTSSLIVNEYRYQFHKKAFVNESSGNHF
ncbi:MAG: hypothetical protein ACXVBQ_10615, partial [Pseudobdellovibrionaceae bacterium]